MNNLLEGEIKILPYSISINHVEGYEGTLTFIITHILYPFFTKVTFPIKECRMLKCSPLSVSSIVCFGIFNVPDAGCLKGNVAKGYLKENNTK